MTTQNLWDAAKAALKVYSKTILPQETRNIEQTG